jgi:hypothetical protein
MNVIRIQETKTSPSVIFDLDNNQFEITGCSRPEDVVFFYQPLVDWLFELKRSINDQLKADFQQNPIVFKLCLDYFNSSSAKYILDIVLIIDELFKNGLNVKIEWRYKHNDEDMLETGEEFTDLIHCPISFVEIP